jgi:hypothetical protein
LYTGAHIPNISSPVEFFDIVYFGIFIILSCTFNPLFYDLTATPQALEDEIASAESHFLSVIHYFSNHHIAVLDLVTVDCWYIVKRMLAEFAAAAVVLSEAIAEFRGGDMDVDIDGLENKGNEADVVLSKVKVKVDDIISQSYPEVMDYYLYCVVTGHKHFVWTGPFSPYCPGQKPAIPFCNSSPLRVKNWTIQCSLYLQCLMQLPPPLLPLPRLIPPFQLLQQNVGWVQMVTI